MHTHQRSPVKMINLLKRFQIYANVTETTSLHPSSSCVAIHPISLLEYKLLSNAIHAHIFLHDFRAHFKRI